MEGNKKSIKIKYEMNVIDKSKVSVALYKRIDDMHLISGANLAALNNYRCMRIHSQV